MSAAHEAKSKTTRTAAGRRVRFGALTAVLLIAMTASCAIAVMLGSTYRTRIDVTATREHTLAPRTQGLLSRLDSPHEIMVIADFDALDPRAAGRIDDVLTEFDRASPHLRYNRIDSISPGDRAAYASLLNRLVDLHADRLARHIEATEQSIESARAVATGMPRLSEAMLALRDALPAQDQRHRDITNIAAVARAWAADLDRVAEVAEEALNDRVAGSNFPPVDRAQRALASPLRRIGDELLTLRNVMDQFAGSLGDEPFTNAPEAAELARDAARVMRPLRDAAARGADALERLAPLELVAIVRTVEAGPCAVIVSPTGATAVRFESLFPSGATIDMGGGAGADLRFTGEELIATAIAALTNPTNPILIFVHGLNERILDDAGMPATPEMEGHLGHLLDRMRLRGIDVAEWAVAQQSSPPTLLELDPEGARPLVWATIGISVTTPEGAERLGRVVSSLEALFEAGEPVLLSVEPSTLPAVGEPDPIATLIEPFGLRIDSGRPLLRRISTASGPEIQSGQTASRSDDSHPIGRAVSGLNTLLPWSQHIEVIDAEDDAHAHAWPLLTLDDSRDIWGEARWAEFRALSGAQRSMVSNPPTPDPRRDNIDGPWTLAAAAERRIADDIPPQRLVVVGSNGWFFDEFTQLTTHVDGRPVTRFPGNAELFEAAVYWLAGLDEFIAPSPRVRDVARLAPIEPGQLIALRWALIAGLPALTLLTGLILRLVRG
ncbi:MAG: hypothetical protein EA376_12340 [Phycisphaeraceae bacterium]|nr:MAG: hypothetical protein EA376_12340 [Phycisphaeraceae bacterium]